MLSTYLTYASISALVASTPGPSNFIAAHNGAKSGLYQASIAITGHMSAVLLLAFLAAIGLSSMIMSSPFLFNAIKLFGAGYLLYIGIKMLASCCSKKENTDSQETLLESSQQHPGKRQLWQQHFFVAATNPKAMIFFTALFPQFINPEISLLSQFIPLACISLCSSFFFPFIYAFLGHNAAKLTISTSLKKQFNLLVSIMFIGFSISLLLS